MKIIIIPRIVNTQKFSMNFSHLDLKICIVTSVETTEVWGRFGSFSVILRHGWIKHDIDVSTFVQVNTHNDVNISWALIGCLLVNTGSDWSKLAPDIHSPGSISLYTH